MLSPDFHFEQELVARGFFVIAGLDEVGRGAWAGPVVAAAAIFPLKLIQAGPLTNELQLVRDSKTLSLNQRTKLKAALEAKTIWSLGQAEAAEIDQLGISQATQLAMTRAVSQLATPPDQLLIDGRDRLNLPLPQKTVIDGDALSYSIAAASILAKLYRDELMNQYAKTYPEYGFASHVGYGTKAHQAALAEYGPCPIHRLSYRPVAVAKRQHRL